MTQINKKQPSINLQQYVRPGLAYTELTELYDAFNLFDINHNGTINTIEFQSALKNMNCDGMQTNQLVLSLFDQLHTSTITFPQFLNLLTNQYSTGDTSMDYHRLFNLFDTDHSGYITLIDMKRVCGELSEALSDNELNDMIERADLDGDGQISYDEFVKMMTYKHNQ